MVVYNYIHIPSAVYDLKGSEVKWTNPLMEYEKFSIGFKNVIKLMSTVLPTM